MPNSFILLLALQVGVVLAFVAMAITIRRPSVGAWTGFWLARLAATAAAALVPAASTADPLRHPVVWTAITGALVVASRLSLLQALWCCEPHARWALPRRLATAALAWYLVPPFLAPAAPAPSGAFALVVMALRVGMLPTDALAIAVTIDSRHRYDRRGARLLIAGLVLVAASDLASLLGVYARLGTSNPLDTPLFIGALQLLALPVLAMGALYVVLAEERAAVLALGAEVERARTFESLGRMASGVAHDFNNLLSIIGLSATSAERATDVQSLHEDLRAIGGAAEEGREMVASLLAYARKEAVVAEPFDLRALVREHERELRRLLPPTHSLTLTLPDAPCPLVGDPHGMLRVLSNLVANGRDAMPRGGCVAIGITLNHAAHSGRTSGPQLVRPAPYASLTVRDEGEGIGPDVLPHIFEPFYTTKGEGRGTGLGLALAQAFVRQAGGEIRVTTAPGRGTTMELRLPIAA